jgi:WS/DGAT/MGAT family acyltransferase
MARPIVFEHRMSDGDALLWNIEKDPLLRSTIVVVWLLDRAPDSARLHDKIERATRAIPRLRERVMANPLSIAPPRWEVDPYFDLSYHVRTVRVAGAGTLRDLLDLAQPLAMQGFDRARPLWELVVVEGLEAGRAALVMKLHHSVSDGVGLVRMTEHMVERQREPRGEPEPMPDAPAAEPPTHRQRFLDAVGYEWRRQLGRARRLVPALGHVAAGLLRDPLGTAREASDLATSVGKLLRPVTEPLSPVMRGRSLSVRFDVLELPLAELKRAAKQAEGTVNDVFVAGVIGGLRLYHQAHGAPLEELRMTMPINIREGENETRAGNQFAPARFAVPVDIRDPVERVQAIGELVRTQRRKPSLGLIEDVAGVLNRLPTAVSTALFGSMLKGIDFVTSNVPGPRFDVYAAGARIDAVYGFGPLAGAALNVTLFSYRDEVRMGINSDPAAIPDPELLLECLTKGFSEVLA